MLLPAPLPLTSCYSRAVTTSCSLSELFSDVGHDNSVVASVLFMLGLIERDSQSDHGLEKRSNGCGRVFVSARIRTVGRSLVRALEVTSLRAGEYHPHFW
jgi:hypothetical protein